MPAIKRSITVIGTCFTLCLLLTSNAQAGGKGEAGQEEAETSGNADGGVFNSKVQFKVTTGGKKGRTGAISPADETWTPPPCWYEPYWDAKNFKKFLEAQWKIGEAVGGDPRDFKKDKDHYKGGEPYKNFNVAKDGKGKWWVPVKNPKMKDDPQSKACKRDPFWVDQGETPAEPKAVDPKKLAELAFQETQVPDTEVEMAPDGKKTVNLPTWMWLDKAKFEPIKVTASLPGTGLSATTTAKPTSLHLDPGTKDAQVHPSSGECDIRKSGSIGTPYKKGNADKTPPCGVTYKRATTSTPPHKLKATLTWKIDWEGSNGQGGNLPDGSFDTTQNITVQEVQARN